MDSLIKNKIETITDCIYNQIQHKQEKTSSLYTGRFGVLLFMFYYAKYSEDKNKLLLAEDYASTLLEQFIPKIKSHTFCEGLSGILYLFDFLKKNKFIDIDISESQSDLDNYLISLMKQDFTHNNYDFMHGALGVGFYFLKKESNTELINELVDFLYNTAEKENENNIFKWKSIIDHQKKIIGYNLGLAHGIPCIIIFLSRIIRSGIVNQKIVEMLTGAVNYILSQQIDFSQYGSYFLYRSIAESPHPITKSRLGWCYGDLGIGIALYQAGKSVYNMEWQEIGIKILLQNTHRLSLNDNLIRDAGICHGSAGIAMIYNRMYIETHQLKFKESTNYWLEQTLNFSQFIDGIAGYKTFFDKEMICDYSLLTGVTGTGLVLLSYLTNDKQLWDDFFLLS